MSRDPHPSIHRQTSNTCYRVQKLWPPYIYAIPTGLINVSHIRTLVTPLIYIAIDRNPLITSYTYMDIFTIDIQWKFYTLLSNSILKRFLLSSFGLKHLSADRRHSSKFKQSSYTCDRGVLSAYRRGGGEGVALCLHVYRILRQ